MLDGGVALVFSHVLAVCTFVCRPSGTETTWAILGNTSVAAKCRNSNMQANGNKLGA
jgi:hypothetical protein